jgi:VWFA-related protein
MKPSVLVVAATIAFLVIPAPPPADAAPERPITTLERATAELVLIETYVTGRNGRPIRGLSARDFVLLVDGVVQPIASVEYREVADPEASPAPAVAGDAAAPPVPDHPRRFILFFDDETSAPPGQEQARLAAERFLREGLTAGDHVALAAFRGRLQLVHDFSRDRASLRAALLQTLRDTRRVSLFDTESRARTETLERVLDSGISGTQSRFALRSIVGEELPYYRRVLGALTSLVDSLAAWPGYKAILVFGDGIAEYPGSIHVDRLNRIPRPEGLELAVQEANLSQELEALGRAAAGAGVTIHTIQTAGLVAGHAGEHRASRRRSNALESLALNTGGVTSSSNDLLRGLVEADRGTRAYYVIGYAPQGAPDGLYHTVRLRVKRGGARLRHRTGFTRFLPDDAHRRAVQAAHLLPELHRDLDVTLTASPGPAEGSVRVTDLVAHVSPGRILFLPEAGRFDATLEAGFTAVGADGRETLRLARRLRISVEPGLAARDDLGFNLVARVRLPAAPQTVTAVVADFARRALGAARLTLPGGSAPARVHGLSLYSLSERSLWVELGDAPFAPEAESAAEFTVGPALKTDFEPGEALACGFRLASRAAAGARLSLGIRAGDRALRTVEIAPGPAGAGPVKVPLPTGDLPPGEYRLVVQELGPGAPVECGSLEFRIIPAGSGREPPPAGAS